MSAALIVRALTRESLWRSEAGMRFYCRGRRRGCFKGSQAVPAGNTHGALRDKQSGMFRCFDSQGKPLRDTFVSGERASSLQKATSYSPRNGTCRTGNLALWRGQQNPGPNATERGSSGTCTRPRIATACSGGERDACDKIERYLAGAARHHTHAPRQISPSP